MLGAKDAIRIVPHFVLPQFFLFKNAIGILTRIHEKSHPPVHAPLPW